MKRALGTLAVAVLATGAATQVTSASTYTLDVANWAPVEFFSFGDPTTNPNFQIDLGAGSIVHGVSYDLSVTAGGTAWLSEFGVAFFPVEVVPDGGPGLIITPGAGDDFDGTAQYSGMHDLNDNIGDPNAPQPFALDSGILWVEGMDWAEAWPGLTDINGSITIYYTAIPAPGALALIGLAGLVGASRRRRA